MIFAHDAKTTTFAVPTATAGQVDPAAWLMRAISTSNAAGGTAGRSRVWFETGDVDADVPRLTPIVAEAVLAAGLATGIDQIAGRYFAGTPADQIVICIRPLAEKSFTAGGRQRIAEAQRRRWARARDAAASST